MKKQLLLGINVAFCCFVATPSHAQETMTEDKVLTCVYGKKKPMTSGEAKVSVKNGTVNHIHFNNYYPGGHGKLSFTCHIDLNRDDEAYIWQDNESGLTVTARENGDTLQLSRTRRGYVLDFANFKSLSKYCGAGAEVPMDLLIPFSGKSCKVRLPQK